MLGGKMKEYIAKDLFDSQTNIIDKCLSIMLMKDVDETSKDEVYEIAQKSAEITKLLVKHLPRD